MTVQFESMQARLYPCLVDLKNFGDSSLLSVSMTFLVMSDASWKGSVSLFENETEINIICKC